MIAAKINKINPAVWHNQIGKKIKREIKNKDGIRVNVIKLGKVTRQSEFHSHSYQFLRIVQSEILEKKAHPSLKQKNETVTYFVFLLNLNKMSA